MSQFQRRSRIESVLVIVFITIIDAYKAILSPLFRGACRFDPSCSQYSREAISKYGVRGVRLAVSRILRCRPFGGHGFDPVP